MSKLSEACDKGGHACTTALPAQRAGAATTAMDSADSGSSAELVNPADCAPSSTNGGRAEADGGGELDAAGDCAKGGEEKAEEKRTDPRLKELEEDGWMDVLDCGDLLRKIMRPGASSDAGGAGDRPSRHQTVAVRVSGRLAHPDHIGIDCEGPVVDQWHKLEFQLGCHEVIDAIEMCVQLMHVGEVDAVRTSSRFAYGSLGREPDIEPDSSLVYELELLSAADAPQLCTLPSADVLAYLERRKCRGNYFYTRGDWHRALAVYDQAIDAMKEAIGIADRDTDGGWEDASHSVNSSMWNSAFNDVAAVVYSNIAAATLKTADYGRCVRACDACLRLQPDNVKTLYRKGKAAAALGEWNDAFECLDRAVELDAGANKLISRERSRVGRMYAQHRERERRLCARMVAAAGGDAWAEPEDGSRLGAFARQNAMLLLACAAALVAVVWYVSGMEQYFTRGHDGGQVHNQQQQW